MAERQADRILSLPVYPELKETELRICHRVHPGLLQLRAKTMKISYSYLQRQFPDIDAYLRDIGTVVAGGISRLERRWRNSSSASPDSAESPMP